MPTCDKTLARGLARERMGTLTEGGRTVFKRLMKARKRLLDERCRDLSRKMRPRDFEAFVHEISDLQELASVREFTYTRAPAPATLRLSWTLRESMTRIDDEQEQALYDYDAWTLVHSRITSDGKRFHEDTWFVPMLFTDHAAQRFVQRSAGAGVSANDLADLVHTAASWALVYLRAHTANTLKGLPSQLIAPVGDGVLLGYLTTHDAVYQPIHVKRDRNGQRFGGGPHTLPGIVVTWQTYLSRDMLYPEQAATLERLEPVLEQTRAALARDPDIARGFQRTDALPAAAYARARASLTPLLRTIRETGMAGFADLTELYPDTTPRDSDRRADLETVYLQARDNVRRLLWPEPGV